MRLSPSLEITELRALPQRVVDVLHRQRRPAGSPARTPARRTPPPDRATSGVIDQPSAAMWCTTATNTCSSSATRNSLARNGISAARSKLVPRRLADGLRQSARRPARWRRRPASRSRPARPAPPPAGVSPRPRRTACAGSRGGATTSASAAPQRLDVQAPAEPQRHRHVVDRRRALQLVEEPQPVLGERQRHHRRPLDRPPAAPAAPSSPPMRGANWATVGASNSVRTASPASRTVLIAAIRRIADSESPPRSKNESSTPTRSYPEHLGVDACQDLLDRASRGAVAVDVRCIPVRAARGCRACR